MSSQVDNRVMIAAGACAIAILLFGTTVARAITADDTATEPVLPRPHSDAASKAADDALSMQMVNEAVANDPFSADRQPNAAPYRLPTDPVEAAPAPPPPPPPALPAFRLVGTTQTPTGSIALIQLDNGTPKVVGVGEILSGFRVDRIDRTSATMVQGERRMELQLQQPALRAEVQNGRRGAPSRGEGGRQDGPAMQKQILQEMQQMLQQRGNGRGSMVVDGVPVRRLPQGGDTNSMRNPRSDR
jgi:hypothetical protein